MIHSLSLTLTDPLITVPFLMVWNTVANLSVLVYSSFFIVYYITWTVFILLFCIDHLSASFALVICI